MMISRSMGSAHATRTSDAKADESQFAFQIRRAPTLPSPSRDTCAIRRFPFFVAVVYTSPVEAMADRSIGGNGVPRASVSLHPPMSMDHRVGQIGLPIDTLYLTLGFCNWIVVRIDLNQVIHLDAVLAYIESARLEER